MGIWEAILENEYLFLTFACCAIVIVPLILCFVYGWASTAFAPRHQTPAYQTQAYYYQHAPQ